MDTVGLTTVSAVAGFFVPFLVSFLKNTRWSTNVKHLLSLAVSVVVAFLITVVDKGVAINNWNEFVLNSGVVFTTANVFYNQFFTGTEMNYTLENSGVGGN